ncbi:MAG: hypothetical protein QOI98_3524 [Solirubrobacteraceae bacterium]|nr:hypothetical protein [Solirubrobacteraceae bacterium]
MNVRNVFVHACVAYVFRNDEKAADLSECVDRRHCDLQQHASSVKRNVEDAGRIAILERPRHGPVKSVDQHSRADRESDKEELLRNRSFSPRHQNAGGGFEDSRRLARFPGKVRKADREQRDGARKQLRHHESERCFAYEIVHLNFRRCSISPFPYPPPATPSSAYRRTPPRSPGSRDAKLPARPSS